MGAELDDIVVISQLPPPFHGSTLMTRVLLETASVLGYKPRLVDRRFSRNVGEVGRLSLGKLLAAPALVMRLIAALFRQRPRIVVFFVTNRPGSFLVDWTLSEVLRAFGVRTIAYVHTQGFKALSARGGAWPTLVRRTLGSANTIVCLSATLESDVIPFCEGIRIVSIPNTPPDTAPALQAVRNSPAGSKVVFLSNLIAEKGIDEFIALAQSGVGRSRGATFVAAGAPLSEHQLANLRATAGDWVDILGKVDAREKWALLDGACLLAFPSRYPFEAQPLVILEAMSLGIPVVAYDIGGIRDIVLDGVTGRLIEPTMTLEFQTAVDSILSSENIRKRMSAASIKMFTERYSLKAYQEAWREELQR